MRLRPRRDVGAGSLLGCTAASLLLARICFSSLRIQTACVAIGPRRSAALGLGAAALSAGDLALRSPSAWAREPWHFEQIIAETGLEDWKLKDYEAMRDDVPRTSKFEAAIRRRLATMPDAAVLDIGTGPFALLAVIAARAGARKVYAIEKNAVAARQARAAIEKHDLQGRIEVIEGDSMQVDLPERVDLIVSELIGSIATQEGVEPIIRDAQERFLKDGSGCGGMIPARCQTCIAPIAYKGRSTLEKLFNPKDGLRSRGRPEPGTARPIRVKATDEQTLLFLAEPQVLEDFDYCSLGSERKLEKTFSFLVPDPAASGVGKFSGFAMWTRVVVDDQDVVEVRGQPDSHWAYVVSLMAPEAVRMETPGAINLKTRVEYDAVPVRYTFQAVVPKT
eukprot:TRINITY_DN53092_c0_g1_i1.p1 TRINITY_DN53092_c0_g1~~TRINITY_DN53092_c0_g1_i1.p1  ORF type:complete len:393 (-),score=78.07 TRINITY_DN53092_c0_g1_i1:30-1208(-)